jgi:hypothetical protein
MLNLIVDFGPSHDAGLVCALTQALELTLVIVEAVLEGRQLVLNVEVGYGEDSSVENKDRKNDNEGVFPFVGRERRWLFCHELSSPFTMG